MLVTFSSLIQNQILKSFLIEFSEDIETGHEGNHTKRRDPSTDAKTERERENNLSAYGKVIHPRIKSYSNATEELMTVQKLWQICEQAQRMALLKSLGLAYWSSNKKFINMASKYSHGLSVAAIQGKPVLGINSGKSCSLWKAQAIDGPLQSMKLWRKKWPSKLGNPQGDVKRSTQVWKYCCRCHNSHNIWRVLH